jgi:hypothetical protein
MTAWASVIVRTGAAFAVCMLTAGCALRGSEDPRAGFKEVLESTSGAVPERTPFVLEVVNEATTMDTLSVQGRLRAKTRWPVKGLEVLLSAMDRDGQPRVSSKRVSDLLPKQEFIEAGQVVEFLLSLPVASSTNYQIELHWGESSSSIVTAERERGSSAREQRLILRNLEAHRIPSETCSTPEDCRVTFTIRGEFFNDGTKTVREALVAYGFVPADMLDSDEQILENEKRVEIRNLSLPPGGSKPFKVKLEKQILIGDQIAPRPVVRILSVQTE